MATLAKKFKEKFTKICGFMAIMAFGNSPLGRPCAAWDTHERGNVSAETFYNRPKEEELTPSQPFEYHTSL